jgi:DNA-binding XRE family transcriptional regulator
MASPDTPGQARGAGCERPADGDVQRLTIDGRGYVLMSEQRYRRLQQLEAMRGQASGPEAAAGLDAVLRAAGLDREQVAGVLAAATFGLRLQHLRRCRGLDQIDLARLAGVSQTMVSNLENDKVERPSARAVHQLLDALGVPGSAAYLVMAARAHTRSASAGSNESGGADPSSGSD